MLIKKAAKKHQKLLSTALRRTPGSPVTATPATPAESGSPPESCCQKFLALLGSLFGKLLLGLDVGHIESFVLNYANNIIVHYDTR